MGKNVQISATGHTGLKGTGKVTGFIVSQHTSGTIKLVDSPAGASGRLLVDTFSFVSGSNVVLLPDGGVEFYEGVYAVIGGTGVIVGLIWSPTTNA